MPKVGDSQLPSQVVDKPKRKNDHHEGRVRLPRSYEGRAACHVEIWDAVHAKVLVDNPTRRRCGHSCRPYLMKTASQSLLDGLIKILMTILEAADAQFAKIFVPMFVRTDDAVNIRR